MFFPRVSPEKNGTKILQKPHSPALREMGAAEQGGNPHWGSKGWCGFPPCLDRPAKMQDQRAISAACTPRERPTPGRELGTLRCLTNVLDADPRFPDARAAAGGPPTDRRADRGPRRGRHGH